MRPWALPPAGSRPLRRSGATIGLRMEQVVAIALVLLVFLGLLGLRLWALLRHRAPGDGDSDLVRRWARHLYRGDRED